MLIQIKMIIIKFIFNQTPIDIQANLDDSFKDVARKYFSKSYLNYTSTIFLLNANVLFFNNENTIKSLINPINKENNSLKILVYQIDSHAPEIKFLLSKDIICPKCNEPCKIKFEDYHIKFYDCPYGHKVDDIKILDFPETQKINMSEIICQVCKINNMENGYNNNHKFFKCLTCGINVCDSCEKNKKHDENHYIVDFENKNYRCPKHDKNNNHFIKFCKKCNLDLCINCCANHNGHEIIAFEYDEILKNDNEITKRLREIKQIVNTFKNNIKNIINTIKKLEELIKIINIYYKINLEVLGNCDKGNINYKTLENIKEVNYNNQIIKILKEFNNTKKMKDKLEKALDIYDKINPKLNEMNIVYKINNNENKINLFHKIFVNNNKDNCYLIINGEKSDLVTEYNLTENDKSKETLEIKLKQKNPFTNLSYMFKDCTSLQSFQKNSYFEAINVKNMENMFSGCNSLISLPDISHLDTKNVTNMSCLFYDCELLKSLPDISNWDTSNVINMNHLFYKCKSLVGLPDLSNWNTKNVKSMEHMFSGCNSLIILPDISDWDTQNVVNTSWMFYDCILIKEFPDISCWDIKNINNMNYMFQNCKSLKSFPNSTNWDFKNVENKEGIFAGVNKKIIPRDFNENGCRIY